MTKNVKVINEIKKFLKVFQEKYIKNDLNNIEEFIKEFFIDDDNTSLLGVGEKSWYFGLSQIESAIRIYWSDKNSYLKNIDLDIENSVINAEENVACIAISGKSLNNISEEKASNIMIDRLSNILNEREISKADLVQFSDQISRSLYDISLGEEYVFPFRTTFITVKDNSKWKIKHMKISFGGAREDLIIDDASIEDEFKILPIKNKEDKEVNEIQKVLEILQEGYDKRDASLVNYYGEKLFHHDENLYIFGTDNGENFHGFEESKELLKCDWKYWGDFNVNKENAYISVLGDMAVVISKAFIKFKFLEKTVCTWPKSNFEYFIRENKKQKELLQNMLFSINMSLNCLESYNENSICPMRFFGVLVKKKGKWKFNHMHFSDIVEGLPSERIIK
ncbi:hypothetical protein UT300019_32720 [Clostridium sp. CTA-19]